MVVTLTKLTSELADNIELYDMSKEEGDEASLLTIEGEAAKLAAEKGKPAKGLPIGYIRAGGEHDITIIKIPKEGCE